MLLSWQKVNFLKVDQVILSYLNGFFLSILFGIEETKTRLKIGFV
jgi:hypothetical protein